MGTFFLSFSALFPLSRFFQTGTGRLQMMAKERPCVRRQVPNRLFLSFQPSIPSLAGLLFVISNIGFGWDDWQVSEADVRFRLARPYTARTSISLRIDIPAALSSRFVGGAFSAGATKLDTRGIRQAGKLMAVEISIPYGSTGPSNFAGSADTTGFPDRAPVFLYLKRQGPDLPQTAPSPKPFAFYMQVENSITRPSTAEEFLIFWNRKKPVTFRRDVASVADCDDYLFRSGGRHRSSHREAISSRRICLSTSLLVPTAGTYRFGTLKQDAIWFVFVDGEGVAGWQEAEPAQGAWLGKAVNLEAGIHDVSLMALVRKDEELPLPALSINGAAATPPPNDRLVASHLPTAVRLEYREGELHPGVEITSQSYVLPKTASKLHTVTVNDRTLYPKSSRKPPVQYALPGKSPRPGGFLVAKGAAPRNLVLSGSFPDSPFAVAVPVFPAQEDGGVIQAGLSIDTLPFCIQPGDDVELQVSIQNPSINRADRRVELSPLLVVECLDAAGQPIHVQESRFESLNDSIFISVPFAPSAASLSLSCRLEGVEIVPRQRIRMLRPEHDLKGIRAWGDRLLLDDEPVILCVNSPMPAGGGGVASPVFPAKGKSLVWVDAYIGSGMTGKALDEQLLSFAGSRGLSISRIGVDQLPSMPVLPELWQFHLAFLALEKQPAGIILGMGVQDLLAGVHRDDVQRRAQFLIQACQERGVIPIIVTPPPIRGIDHEEGRIAALSFKRLALRLGVPVVDAYSQAYALQTRKGHVPFEKLGVLPQGVRLGSMNDKGREWFLTLLVHVLSSPQSR